MRSFIGMCAGFLVGLLVVNLAVGAVAKPIPFRERLVMDDTFYNQNGQIDQAIAQIGRTPGYKVIALGDSTMYGALVGERETTPAYLQESVAAVRPDAHVFNLAYPGARPADLYAMLKRVEAAKPDLVVVDLNIAFFAERVLQEGALANQSNKREFLFESVVPHGVFTENRFEEAVGILLKETNLGRYKDAINRRLFGKAPRHIVRDQAARLNPVELTPSTPGDALPPEAELAKLWHEKSWGEAERKRMARIYEQGPLTESNDSVKMLRQVIRFGKEHNMNVLYYLSPQNEALIGRFFAIDQLHENQQYLHEILQSEKTWFIDLGESIPERYFADYIHMLQDGNRLVAQSLSKEIAPRVGSSQ